MGIIQSIKDIFKPRPLTIDPFAVKKGEQHTFDPLLCLNAQVFFAGLKDKDKLPLYWSIYHSQPIAVQCVNTIVKMVNGRIVPKSGNPAVDARMKEIWHELDLHTVNAQLLRQSLIYGFAVAEWVTEDDFASIDRVVVPDSAQIRFQPNRHGQIVNVRQLVGTVFAPQDPKSQIPADKFVILRRDPMNAFDYYGESLFQSCVDAFEAIARILGASIAVMMRNGRPRFVVTVPAEGLTQEQFQERLDQAEAAMSRIGDEDATDIFMPAGCEVNILGAEGFNARFTEETRLFLQNVCASAGLPPALLHVVTQGSSGAEAFQRQIILSLQSIFDSIQQSNAAAWHNFCRVIAAIEGMPVIPHFEFEPPRLLEAIQEENARKAQFDNDLRETIFGIHPPEWLAHRCGVTEPDDLDALYLMVDLARQNYSPAKDTGSETGNSSAATSTKLTDEQQSSSTFRETR